MTDRDDIKLEEDEDKEEEDAVDDVGDRVGERRSVLSEHEYEEDGVGAADAVESTTLLSYRCLKWLAIKLDRSDGLCDDEELFMR